MPETSSQTMEIVVRLKDLVRTGFSNLKKELSGVQNQASRTSNALRGVGERLRALKGNVFSLKTAFAGLGLGLLVRSFVNAAAEAEQFRVRLVALTGDINEANDLFQSMAEFASQVSFEYKDIMESATNLRAVMKGGNEEVKRYMPLIADLAAVTGLSIQETTSQVIRMYSAGAAAADMFRERGVLAMLGFQTGVSVSAEETRKRLLAAWEDPASQFRGASVLLSHTWQGMLSMMSDAWFQFRNAVMEAGIFDYIKGALDLVLDRIRRMKEEGRFEDFARNLANNVIKLLDKIILLSARVTDGWNAWKQIITGLKGAFALFAEGVSRGLAFILRQIERLIHGFGIVKETFGRLTKDIQLQATGAYMKNLSLGSKTLQKQAEWWKNIFFESGRTLKNLQSQETAYQKATRLLKEIHSRARAAAQAFAEAQGRVRGPAPTPEVSFVARLKSQLTRLQETTKTELAIITDLYQKGQVSLKEYFDKRTQLLNQQFEREKTILEKQAELETNPDKKQAILDKIFALEQTHQRNLLKLNQERLNAEEKQAQARLQIEQLLQDQKKRISELGTADLRTKFDMELQELDRKHQAEIEKLKQLNATKVQLEEAYRNQKLEKDRLLAQQEQQIQQMTIQGFQQTYGALAQAFSEAYDASGKKIKEFFYLQKAASIAQTLISTYQAAQEAYKALVGIPVVGPTLATAAAAAAIAAGLARVAMIRAQTPAFAEGGEIPGRSPSSRADNILVRATAGEFIHPVHVVRYYGKDTMEAIRRKIIPREILSQFTVTGVRTPNYGFAEGGAVNKSGFREGRETGTNLNIVNVIDPNLMDEYMSSVKGQRTLLNIISQNAYQIKQALVAEG